MEESVKMTTGVHTPNEAGTDGRGTVGWGRRLPVALLLLALMVAGFGAFEAYRSQRSHSVQTASLLEDYGGFAAFTYQQQSARLLNDLTEIAGDLPGPVTPGTFEPPAVWPPCGFFCGAGSMNVWNSSKIATDRTMARIRFF